MIKKLRAKANATTPHQRASAGGMSMGTALSIMLAWVINDVVGYQVPAQVTIAMTVVLMESCRYLFTRRVDK